MPFRKPVRESRSRSRLLSGLLSMPKLTLVVAALLVSVYAAHLLLKMSFTMVKAISKTMNSPTRFSCMVFSDAFASDFDTSPDYRIGCGH